MTKREALQMIEDYWVNAGEDVKLVYHPENEIVQVLQASDDTWELGTFSIGMDSSMALFTDAAKWAREHLL